jgi:hypothetical protein
MVVRLLLAVIIVVMQRDPSVPSESLTAPAPSPASGPLFSTMTSEPVLLPAAFVGRVLLRANVNGDPVWLHLDTGNYTLLVGTDDARKASLVPDPVTHNSQRVRVSMGDVVAPAVFFKVSHYGFEDNGYWVAGNIGTPFLRGNVVTIDYPKQRAIFYPRGGFKPPSNVKPTPIFMLNNIPTIEVSFGAVKGRFDLDTGAAITEISPDFARRIRLGPNIGELASFGCGNQETDAVHIVPDFTVADVTVKRFSAVVANPCGSSQDGILGRDLLSHFSVTLDYVNHLLYLASPS